MRTTPGERDTTAAPTLLFQHIPKTAGTALRDALGSLYPERERAYLYDPADLRGAVAPGRFPSMPPEQMAGLRFVAGHFDYGVHRSLHRPFRYVTILRDAVDRVASLYYHFKVHAGTSTASEGFAEHAWIEGEGLSLEEWVFGTNQLQADNGMVRQISGRHGVPFGTCPDDLLTEALEHIDADYAAVLIRGLMSQGVQVLEALTGRALPRIERRNTNPSRVPLSEIDPDVRRRILELNELDAKLFRRMTERFPATYGRIVGRRGVPSPTSAGPRPGTQTPDIDPIAGPRPIEDRTLLFMHIAKTGGTSVRRVLADAYAKDERIFVYDPADLRGAVSSEQFKGLPEDRRMRLRLVMGHFQYGIHRDLGRPFRYMTILRDPVERIVSLYYHYRHLRGLRIRGPARAEQSLLRRTGMSLGEWVFGQQRLAVDNGMTRNIAARPRVGFGECPDDLLDEALEHIDHHFAVVLVLPELDRSLPLMAGVIGRSLKPIPHSNVNRSRLGLEELDPTVLDRIRELNRLDVRLYQRARERLVVSGAERSQPLSVLEPGS